MMPSFLTDELYGPLRGREENAIYRWKKKKKIGEKVTVANN